MNQGDVITRTVGGATASVTLPPVNMNHLLTIGVEGGRVRGFHILPTTVVTISSTDEIPLPAGSIQVVDSAGNPMAGVEIKLTPLRVPASADDALKLEWKSSIPREPESLSIPQRLFTRKDGPRPRFSKQFIPLTWGITRPVVPRSSCG
jgi:hypothetical protein